MNKPTLVIGASTNPERYSFKAITSLVNHGHKVYALGLKPGKLVGVEFDVDKKTYSDVDTVTLYVGPANQSNYFDYIVSIKPKRVVFNPGTENDDLAEKLESKGIEVIEACTLVMLSTNQY